MSVSSDLAVFVNLMCHCFETISGSVPILGGSSIEIGLPKLCAYSGFISVSGPLNGWVSLSIPGDLADSLLNIMNEPNRSEEYRLDLAGEIASTVASNARGHFGERLLVRPALVTTDDVLPDTLQQPPLVLKIPFTWNNHKGQLLIGINH
jgi:chemotaxis protein CheX